ncbi:MAG: aldehyde dehydrogenase family protein, partial [Muribaculaceae bacterium]|nr:aldehyde dehydrogenase family protein [Muribaculaceae bacterium]
MKELFDESRTAAVALQAMSAESINEILMTLADDIEAGAHTLLEANAADLARMDAANPRRDRLALTQQRIADIADGVRAVASLPSPVGKILSQWTRPNGMTITKVSVPFGVIGVIYEARPNVTFDVFALCLKAGSAVLLKGGHEAADTNRAAIAIIRGALERAGAPTAAATLLPDGREATAALLAARGCVELIIPRGSSSL